MACGLSGACGPSAHNPVMVDYRSGTDSASDPSTVVRSVQGTHKIVKHVINLDVLVSSTVYNMRCIYMVACRIFFNRGEGKPKRPPYRKKTSTKKKSPQYGKKSSLKLNKCPPGGENCCYTF